MLKREMKINLKSFIIWMSIILGLFLLIYLVYPSIINSDNIKFFYVVHVLKLNHITISDYKNILKSWLRVGVAK